MRYPFQAVVIENTGGAGGGGTGASYFCVIGTAFNKVEASRK